MIIKFASPKSFQASCLARFHQRFITNQNNCSNELQRSNLKLIDHDSKLQVLFQNQPSLFSLSFPCSLIVHRRLLTTSKNFFTQSFSSLEASNPSSTNEQEEIEKENAEKEKKRRRQKKITNYTLLGMLVTFSGSVIYAFFTWGAPKRDDDGNVIQDEFSDLSFLPQHASRAWKTLTHYNQIIKEPSRELLLPPPLPPPYYQPPYTIVMEMTGILVNPEWTYKTGWRFKKRPMLDYFLHQCAMSTNFELVIYTHEQGITAFPLLNSLDPNGYIMYRLFRDSTRYEDGVHIKDLNRLNRDLKKVIHIDWDAKACRLNQENCFTLKKWDGDSDDRTLYDLTNFLMAIANERVEDVRDVLRHYSQFDDPLEKFKENQRKLAENEEKTKEEATKQSGPAYKSFLMKALR
ncbi:Mitochondrial import inner membrane translocase subunit TIM50-C [Sarcoptes scabiei]|uniref:Mitochondrial import inner membrane translocase subunit TIM50 n=1 Tax=Sarcoptes scabiei TaxID=52283 RepID=A0A834R9L1_SARSC|nr:Mitochondrial import inner membrane translocase subunit TIM50-C [Sarcoptes scabiei]